MAESPLTLDVGDDIYTAYISRGVMQENAGLITQPWARMGYTAWTNQNGDSPINSLTLVAGTWNSVHSEKTLASGDNDFGAWYEMDTIVGTRVGLYKHFTVELDYINFYAPNDGWDTGHELDLTTAYDDSYIWHDRYPAFNGFQPYVTVMQEFGSHGAYNPDIPGTMLAIGMRPGITHKDVTLSFPTQIGVNVADYYGNDSDTGFAYLVTGPLVSIALDQHWSLNIGTDLWVMGSQVRDCNPTSTNHEVVGHIGLSAHF